MTSATNLSRPKLQYHPNAYDFVFEALQEAQEIYARTIINENEQEEAHVSGQELLEGVRALALKQFGLMTTTVFKQWGVKTTKDFGKMVFEMIEHGRMRKTENDRLEDFVDLYDFEQVFNSDYIIDTSQVFNRRTAEHA
ncbi:MAG: Minf_1886 family protein [Planctomycetota bacterium]|uniref:Minf_1886 family protein n=1 Tax=uncultured Gimesia sp. TaxID=1678688 RepID=UPI002619302B|nr:Minf_1886 family protein [uncultured Gimesia sp.]